MGLGPTLDAELAFPHHRKVGELVEQKPNPGATARLVAAAATEHARCMPGLNLSFSSRVPR